MEGIEKHSPHQNTHTHKKIQENYENTCMLTLLSAWDSEILGI
jgi:hypothetical protein